MQTISDSHIQGSPSSCRRALTFLPSISCPVSAGLRILMGGRVSSPCAVVSTPNVFRQLKHPYGRSTHTTLLISQLRKFLSCPHKPSSHHLIITTSCFPCSS